MLRGEHAVDHWAAPAVLAGNGRYRYLVRIPGKAAGIERVMGFRPGVGWRRWTACACSALGLALFSERVACGLALHPCLWCKRAHCFASLAVTTLRWESCVARLRAQILSSITLFVMVLVAKPFWNSHPFLHRKPKSLPLHSPPHELQGVPATSGVQMSVRTSDELRLDTPKAGM